MAHLQLTDLHNPGKVKAIHVCTKRDGGIVEAGVDQGFQERKGSWELWQKLEDGRLLQVKRWLKRSVIATYDDKE